MMLEDIRMRCICISKSKGFIAGDTYEYSLASGANAGYYFLYTNGSLIGKTQKPGFDLYFMDLIEYRNNKLDKILE